MAKQTVNPIEQHVEKAILGVAVVVLVAVVGLFLFGRPNTLSIGSETLGPTDVGAKLKAKADTLATTLRGGAYEVKPLDDFKATLINTSQRGPAHMIPWIPEQLPRVAVWGTPVPDVGGADANARKIALANILACGKPVAKTGKSYGIMEEPIDLEGGGDSNQQQNALDDRLRELRGILGQTESQDLAWVTLATQFDLAAQRLAMRQQGYEPARSGIHVTRVELQRQHQLSDGMWSDWEDVSPYLPVKLPAAPKVAVGDDNRIPAAQWTILQYYYELVRDEQEMICRPTFALQYQGGEEWAPPELPGLKEWLRAIGADEADGYAVQTGRSGGFGGGGGIDAGKSSMDMDAGKSGGGAPTGGRSRTSRTPTGGQDERTERIEAMAQFKKAKEAIDKQDWEEAQALLVELQKSPSLTSQQLQLEKMLAQAEEGLAAKIDREAEAALAKLQARQRAEQEGRLDEWMQEHGLPETAYYWSHDLNVSAGGVYRYRCRVVLYNWYVGIVSKLKDKTDAEAIELAGAWSEASDPITVEPNTYFFVTSANQAAAQARVSVFKWFRAQWLKADFPVRSGDSIGQTKKIRLLDDDTGELSRRLTPIDFSTGATVVDVEFGQPVRFLRERPAGQFDLDTKDDSVVLACQGPDGELFQRFQALDGTDSKRQELTRKVKEAQSLLRDKDRSRTSNRADQTRRSGGSRRSPRGQRGGGGGGGGDIDAGK